MIQAAKEITEKLIGIDVDRFIEVTLENQVDEMLENAETPSSRIIEDESILEIFGVL